MGKLKLGFLASHGGSNMQAIVDACRAGRLTAMPAVVISNNSKSGAIERAEREGIPHYHISGKTHPGGEDEAIADVMAKREVDLVILAGYMKKLGTQTLRQFGGRILNIHPALLPKFGGKRMYGKYVHEAVLRAGEKVSGPTVHLVDEQYDRGRILAQTEVPVLPDDTVESLSERVLEQEHKLYPATIQRIATGEIEI
jgi:phosphoribosylglycinamide formyltransferase-1